MDPTTRPGNRQRRRQERKIWRTALLISLLAHVLVFFLWQGGPDLVSPFAAAGPRAGDDAAAAGSMRALAMRTPQPVPVVPPPVPVPADIEIDPIDFEEVAAVDPSAGLGEAPGVDAPGTLTGRGRGDGGTGEEGLNRLNPPSPRGMIIPPENDGMRGREVQVWVWVNERGRVVPDSTVLRPPTPDKNFNNRLIREAAEWIFNPATKDGEPVATWYHYTFSM